MRIYHNDEHFIESAIRATVRRHNRNSVLAIMRDNHQANVCHLCKENDCPGRNRVFFFMRSCCGKMALMVLMTATNKIERQMRKRRDNIDTANTDNDFCAQPISDSSSTSQ